MQFSTQKIPKIESKLNQNLKWGSACERANRHSWSADQHFLSADWHNSQVPICILKFALSFFSFFFELLLISSSPYPLPTFSSFLLLLLFSFFFFFLIFNLKFLKIWPKISLSFFYLFFLSFNFFLSFVAVMGFVAGYRCCCDGFCGQLQVWW